MHLPAPERTYGTKAELVDIVLLSRGENLQTVWKKLGSTTTISELLQVVQVTV